MSDPWANRIIALVLLMVFVMGGLVGTAICRFQP